MIMHRFLILLASGPIIAGLMSCGPRKAQRLAGGPPGTTYHEVAGQVAGVAQAEQVGRIQTLDDEGLASIANCRLLVEGEAEFALAQNDVSAEALGFREQGLELPLRTVLPMYPEICFILHKPEIEADSLAELVCGRRVAIGPPDSGTAGFMRTLFAAAGIEKEQYTAVQLPFADNVLSDEIDVVCSLTGFNNPRIRHMLDDMDARMFSLGEVSNYNQGSRVEGFAMYYPRCMPYIVPQGTYGSKPDRPILTAAVYCVLLTHRDTDPELVSDLAGALIANSPILANDNVLLSQLTEDFPRHVLNFPLHEGTIRYLERNEPSFLERYAEVIALIGSGIALLYTGYRGWKKRRALGRKNRIDVYYEAVFEVSRRVAELSDPDALVEARAELKKLRADAFSQLIDEELQADESFRIFVTLLNDTTREIGDREVELRAAS